MKGNTAAHAEQFDALFLVVLAIINQLDEGMEARLDRVRESAVVIAPVGSSLVAIPFRLGR